MIKIGKQKKTLEERYQFLKGCFCILAIGILIVLFFLLYLTLTGEIMTREEFEKKNKEEWQTINCWNETKRIIVPLIEHDCKMVYEKQTNIGLEQGYNCKYSCPSGYTVEHDYSYDNYALGIFRGDDYCDKTETTLVCKETNQQSWQTIGCSMVNRTLDECFSKCKAPNGGVYAVCMEDCIKPIQVCKAGRYCKEEPKYYCTKVGHLTCCNDEVKLICQECRNSLTKQRIEC